MNDGGPFFPTCIESIPMHERKGLEQFRLIGGASLRDWFGGIAMQGILSAPEYFPEGDTVEIIMDQIAEHAWKQADAMLAQREVKK